MVDKEAAGVFQVLQRLVFGGADQQNRPQVVFGAQEAVFEAVGVYGCVAVVCVLDGDVLYDDLPCEEGED